MMQNEPGSYITIQSWMVKELKLKGNELIVYALIHGFCQDGKSYFYGSTKYIMENTNLSKETVLSVLQSLTNKELVVKKDVKSYRTTLKDKNAHGCVHYSLYYTAISRLQLYKNCFEIIPPGNPSVNGTDGSGNLTRESSCGSENLTRKNGEYREKDFENSEKLSEKAEKTAENAEFWSENTLFTENDGSRNLTRENDDGSGNLTRTGQEFRPATGQEFRPNKLIDNKFDTTTSSEKQNHGQETGKTEEEEIKDYITEKFGGMYPLDDNYASKLLDFIKDVPDKEKYVDYAFERAAEKKPESLPNLFYKMSLSPALLFDYERRNRAERRKVIICPVCGMENDAGENKCSACDFDFMYYGDEKLINVERQVFSLPAGKKAEFRKEMADYEEKCSETYKKAGVFADKETLDELTDELVRIYHKYGIKDEEYGLKEEAV
ncbi:MAG: helix-turn-helix domain-containing protein [Spirochaetaceae bacterium]|nr:helix-turn-helix domain-containing protein [Spirochaetaceae bacterium]